MPDTVHHDPVPSLVELGRADAVAAIHETPPGRSGAAVAAKGPAAPGATCTVTEEWYVEHRCPGDEEWDEQTVCSSLHATKAEAAKERDQWLADPLPMPGTLHLVRRLIVIILEEEAL